MKVEKFYCDFCGKELMPKVMSRVHIEKNNGQWEVSSIDNCHDCFIKIYNFAKSLKVQFNGTIEYKGNE